MTFTFRAISFTDETASLACFATSYSARVDGKGNATDLISIPSDSNAILHTLHDLAIEREWTAAVQSTLPGTSEEIIATQNSLIAQGPGVMLRPVPSGMGDEQDVLHDPRLVQKADIIRQRKTIFLLPEDPSKVFAKKEKRLIDRISDQLHTFLEHASWPDFSFVRAGVAGEEKGMLDQLLDNLHGKMSAEVFKDSPAEREGPVLLCGLTGTGKTLGTRLFAQSLGLNFIHVNLSAVTDTTLESRLRGYVAGSFTGANPKGADGWFKAANNGLLFFDEFQSVSVQYQIQLLDLLNAVSDQVEITQMGKEGTKREVFKVKVVLAVNEDIGELRASGRLREDLFFRMRHLLMFPTLRERLNKKASQLDVLLNSYRWRSAPTITKMHHRDIDTAGDDHEDLQIHRLRTMFPKIDSRAISHLLSHDWPGNLRELERVASDLFCDADDNQERMIGLHETARAVDRFKLSGSTAVPAPLPIPLDISKEMATIIDTVERTLQKHHFVLSRTLIELKLSRVYKITSRKTLKRFLEENRHHLSAALVNEVKIRKFMRWTDAQTT